MKTVRSAVIGALEDTGVEQPRKRANRVLEALAESGVELTDWLVELGVLQHVGYTTEDMKRIRSVALNKADTVRVFVLADDVTEEGGNTK